MLKRKVKHNFFKVCSLMLSLSVVLTSLPFVVVANAANEISIPDKTVEGDRYDPEFSYDEDYYNGIINSVKNVKTIGKLPSYDEFVETTGYSYAKKMSLTEFRKTYGTDANFGQLEAGMPANDISIQIKTQEEFLILSCLVGGFHQSFKCNMDKYGYYGSRIDCDATDEEKAYYSTASYELIRDLNIDCERVYPIGTAESPFNGSFNGRGHIISGVTISGDSEDAYPSDQFLYFGVFGSIGNNGSVENLGVKNTNIDLPYIVGADVGVLCGRNYGTIFDCYIAGKADSKISVSNATVGGIAAENYGTIKNTYSDFYADVAVTTGSYSEPQPITAINSGSIINSYYIQWQNCAQGSSYTLTDDDGNKPCLVGWKAVSYTGFNGTGLSLDDFCTELPGTHFSAATVKSTVFNDFCNLINLNDFIDRVGTGADFNLQEAQNILSQPNAKLCIVADEYTGNNVWNKFADLVNHEAENETDAEQQFYANVDVALGGYDYIESYYGNTIHRQGYDSFDLRCYDYYSDPAAKSIGCEDYPFNGTFDGNNCRIELDVDDYNGKARLSALFGVLGTQAEVKNIAVYNSILNSDNAKVNLSFNETGTIISRVNNGYIHDCIVSSSTGMYHSNPNIPSTDKSLYASLLDGDMVYSYALENNGTIENCDSLFYFTCDYMDQTKYIRQGINAVKVNNGTVNNLYIGSGTGSMDNFAFNNIGTKVNDFNTHAYTGQPNLNGVLKQSFDSIVIDQYPKLMNTRPSQNSEGKYMIRTPEDLDYFIQYGQGESLVLMNTINMCDYLYTGNDSGYFDIDGTLTDENDICSYIDLGTGTKCYGILNLSIEGSSLSDKFVQGKGAWHNIYFIGGSIHWTDTYNGKYTSQTGYDYFRDYDLTSDSAGKVDNIFFYLLGREISNVHYNWDILIDSWDIDSFSIGDIWCSPHTRLAISKQADTCSSCGRIIGCFEDACLLGYTSTKCDSYIGKAGVNEYQYGHGTLYCIGNDVSYSTTHAYFGTYGMGFNVDHCRYDARNETSLKHIFGSEVTNSVFDGTIDGRQNVLGLHFSNFVFDTDGIANNCFSGMVGSHILFRGTINVTGDYNSFYNKTVVFGVTDENNAYWAYCSYINPDKGTPYADNVINDGVINVAVNSRTCYVYGMGFYVEGKMNGRINVTGDATNSSQTYIYYYGSGKGQNYSDVVYDNEDICITSLGVFENNDCACENYGAVNVSGNVYMLNIANEVSNCINYGNVNISGPVESFSVITAGVYDKHDLYYRLSVAKNYGDVTIVAKKDCDLSVIKYNLNVGSRVYGNGDYVYNAGRFDISGDDEYHKVKALGSCYINYGSMLVHDILLIGSSSFTESYAFSLGGLTLLDFDLAKSCGCDVVGLDYKEPYYSSSQTQNYKFYDSYFAEIQEPKKDITNHKKLYGPVLVKNGTGTNYSRLTVKSGKMDVYDNNIEYIYIRNIPYLSDFTAVDFYNNNSYLFSVESNGQSDVTVRNSPITRIEIDMGNVDNVNSGNCNVHDISGVTSIDINKPVTESSSSVSRYSYVNTGNYTVKDIHSGVNAKLNVNGTIFKSSTQSSSLNIGDFDIEFAGDIKVQGVGGSDDGMMFNSINAGNITVKQLNSDCKTYVGAISCSRLSRAGGLINYGNISVDGIKIRDEQLVNKVKDVQNIITATVDVSREIYDFVNYGDVSINVASVEDGADVNKICQFIGFFTTSQYVWSGTAFPVGRGFSPSQDTRFDAAIGCNFGTFTSNYGNSFMRGASAVSYSVLDELTGRQSGSFCDSIVDLNQDTINTTSEYVDAGAHRVFTSNLVFANRSLSDIIEPNFCFRKDNLYEEKYISTEDKIQVNGLNNLEYADIDEFCGLTAAKLASDYQGATGSYALCMVTYKPVSGIGATLQEMASISPIRGSLGRDVEEAISISNDIASKNISTKWGNRSLRSLLSNELKQRDKNTWVEFGSQNPFNASDMIQTAKSYTSKAGGSEQISSKTSLIYEQLPGVCGNDRYSNNTLTTIMDIYVPFEDYNIPNVSLLKYKVGTIPVTSGAKFKVFKQPIVAEDTADLKNKMKELMTDENTTVLGEVSENSVINLPYKSDSDIVCYAVIGAAVSNDGRRINLLGIRVHAVSILASAQIKDVSYPTNINSDGSGLIYSKFTAESDSDNSVYDTTYESVDAGDEGHVVYPVYTLKNDMYHYTDGAFVKDNKNRNKWTNSLADEENCKVTMSLDFVNTKGYQIIYNDDLGLPFEMFDASSMVMSDDGTHLSVSKKDIDLSKFKNKNYELYYNQYIYSYGSLDDLSSSNRSDYIFTNGGEYTLTVYGVPYATNDDSKRVILCKIVFNRELSPENYLKTKNYGFTRCDVIHSDGVSSYTRNVDKFDLSFFASDLYFSADCNDKLKQLHSSKAYVDRGEWWSSNSDMDFNGETSYHDFVQSEQYTTYYPAHLHSLATIRAENGDTADYVYDSWLRDKPEYIPLSSLTSDYGDSGYISGNAYVLTDNSTQAKFTVNYDKNSITPSSTTPYLKCLKVYNSSGELVDIINRTGGYNITGCDWANIEFKPMMDKETGLRLLVKPYQGSSYYSNKNINFDTFSDDFYTFVPVIALGTRDSFGHIDYNDYYIELDSFQIHKTKLSLHRAINVHWDKTLVTSVISTQANELSNDVDIFGSGVIDYINTPDETNHFYINNCVEPNLAEDDMHIELPPLASLQENINGEWTTVFSAGSSREYIKHFNYTREKLLAGVDYQFRIIAQDYDESDDVLKTHVSYYNTRINASMRNKLVSIEFDTGEETMDLYREILSNHGNTAIQVKNMNGTNAVFQQTKLYTGTSEANMASTYYKLSQGDYVIDVQVPNGYAAKVKIVGGSSEGYLQAHSEVKGDRIRMPYANAQTIRLVVYLERSTSSETWGVVQHASSYMKVRNNLV